MYNMNLYRQHNRNYANILWAFASSNSSLQRQLCRTSTSRFVCCASIRLPLPQLGWATSATLIHLLS